MDTYQKTAVEHGRNAMTLTDAKTLAELVDNDSLNNIERLAIQNAIKLFASKLTKCCMLQMVEQCT